MTTPQPDSPALAQPSFTPGTKPIGRAAYVRLDGWAGITKLFGVVTAETASYVTFVPDHDFYRFRKGVAKRVHKRHIRYLLVEYTEDCAVTEAKDGVA